MTAVLEKAQVWLIHRPINGITINPREYVLCKNNYPKEFASRDAAIEFCEEHGIPWGADWTNGIDAFDEIECLECGNRWWEMEDEQPADACPECGNADKEKTIMLMPKYLDPAAYPEYADDC